MCSIHTGQLGTPNNKPPHPSFEVAAVEHIQAEVDKTAAVVAGEDSLAEDIPDILPDTLLDILLVEEDNCTGHSHAVDFAVGRILLHRSQEAVQLGDCTQIFLDCSTDRPRPCYFFRVRRW